MKFIDKWLDAPAPTLEQARRAAVGGYIGAMFAWLGLFLFLAVGVAEELGGGDMDTQFMTYGLAVALILTWMAVDSRRTYRDLRE